MQEFSYELDLTKFLFTYANERGFFNGLKSTIDERSTSVLNKNLLLEKELCEIENKFCAENIIQNPLVGHILIQNEITLNKLILRGYNLAINEPLITVKEAFSTATFVLDELMTKNSYCPLFGTFFCSLSNQQIMTYILHYISMGVGYAQYKCYLKTLLEVEADIGEIIDSPNETNIEFSPMAKSNQVLMLHQYGILDLLRKAHPGIPSQKLAALICVIANIKDGKRTVEKTLPHLLENPSDKRCINTPIARNKISQSLLNIGLRLPGNP